MQDVKIQLLSNFPGPRDFVQGRNLLPLYAAISEPILLQSKDRKAIPSGIALQMPIDVEGSIVITEELALNSDLLLLNSPGTIDPDYRGEIMVIVSNQGKSAVRINPGRHLANLHFHNFERAQFINAQTDT